MRAVKQKNRELLAPAVRGCHWLCQCTSGVLRGGWLWQCTPGVMQPRLVPALFRTPGIRSIICLLALLLCVPRPAAGQQSMDFATGADFARRLRQPVQISWSQSPLRPSLERLAQTQRVAVFLDRRLDPQRPLDLHLPLTPLAESLEQIARDQDAAVSWLDPVVYLGPPATTAKLATLLELNRQQLQQVPESARRGWETPAPTSWALLSQPRQLVQQMAGQRGVTLEGVDQIPHDLWAAQQLPPLDLLQQLTIVLAGFDLCVVLDANGQARVASIPQRVAVTRSYTLTDRQWSRWPQWSATLAGIESQRVGRELVLAARAEDHRRVSDWLQGSKPARRS